MMNIAEVKIYSPRVILQGPDGTRICVSTDAYEAGTLPLPVDDYLIIGPDGMERFEARSGVPVAENAETEESPPVDPEPMKEESNEGVRKTRRRRKPAA